MIEIDAMPPHSRRLTAAIDPSASTSNEFVNRFTRSIEQLGYSVEPFDWSKIGHIPYSLIILHWPNEFFSRSSRSRVLPRIWRLWRSKIRYRTKIIWIAHNLKPHESENGWVTIQRLFLKSLSGIIFLSRFSRNAVNSLYRTQNVKQLVTVHGAYESDIPLVARPYNVAPKLLFFGQIRPYKNLEVLIAAARASSSDFHLTIVGHCRNTEYGEQLADLSGGDHRIRLDLRSANLDPVELDSIIDAADGVVLPYKTVLNSGAALHALSRARPVLVPAMGSLPELQESIGKTWVHLYEAEIAAEQIDAFVAALCNLPPDAQPDLTGYKWDRVTEDLRLFLSQLN